MSAQPVSGEMAQLSAFRRWAAKSRSLVHWFLLAETLAAFLVISLWNLDRLPRVHQDEPWIASVSWKLSSSGVFGSDLFTGFYGMERHYYEFMPLYPLLQAILFKFLGVGLWQARLLSVMLGLLTLCLTYFIARHLFGLTVALLAILALVLVRLTAYSDVQMSGIPLVDVARVGRYDIAVPVFGLAALNTYLTAERERSRRLYFISGVVASLASLSHLSGATWPLSLVALAIWDRLDRSRLAALVAGIAVPCVSYALFVFQSPSDWVGQLSLDAGRFDVWRPTWLVQNLLDEPGRYAPGLDAALSAQLLRPGFFSALVFVPISIFWMGHLAISERDSSSRSILVPLLMAVVGLAFLVHLKTPAYAVSIYPLVAIASACGARRLWLAASEWRRGAWARAAMTTIAIACIVEGASALLAAGDRADQTTPYQRISERLEANLQLDDVVLGLHTYWFGLEDVDFRSWLVPISQSDVRFWSPPLTPDESLSRIEPTVIVFDPGIDAHLSANPDLETEIRDWMNARGFHEADRFDDRTYGPFQIFRRESTAP